ALFGRRSVSGRSHSSADSEPRLQGAVLSTLSRPFLALPVRLLLGRQTPETGRGRAFQLPPVLSLTRELNGLIHRPSYTCGLSRFHLPWEICASLWLDRGG